MWNAASVGYFSAKLATLGGVTSGLIIALVTLQYKNLAAITGPLFALSEGFLLGGVFAIFENHFAWHCFQICIEIFGVFLGMIIGHKLGVVRCGWEVAPIPLKAFTNEKFAIMVKTVDRNRSFVSFLSCIFMCIAGIATAYLYVVVIRLQGIPASFIHESGIGMIGVYVLVVTVASLQINRDYEYVSKELELDGQGAFLPKSFEWYAVFTLIASLVWIYVEILKVCGAILRVFFSVVYHILK